MTTTDDVIFNDEALKELAPSVSIVEAEEKKEQAQATPQEPQGDLSNFEPMLDMLHKILFDILGFEPEDKNVKILNQEAMKLIKLYAPKILTAEKYAPLVAYFGTMGIILMSSKKKGEIEDNSKQDAEYKEINEDLESVENV